MKLTRIHLPDGLVHYAEADSRPGVDCAKAYMLHDDERPWANVLCQHVYIPLNGTTPAREEAVTCLKCLVWTPEEQEMPWGS